MIKNINTIVEGCMLDTPEKLMYCGIELAIPKNVNLVLNDDSDSPRRYLLHANTTDFANITILDDRVLDCDLRVQDPDKSFSGGWPITSFHPHFRYIFDDQRALVTRDGRIFIQVPYFHESGYWYFNNVPLILRQCAKIFSGQRTDKSITRGSASASLEPNI
jgi:hypothetical protein